MPSPQLITVTELSDLLAADAHFAYYRKRTLIERLHEDVVVPAKSKHFAAYVFELGDGLEGEVKVVLAPLVAEEHSIDRKEHGVVVREQVQVIVA